MDKGAIRSFAIEARKILMKSAITEAGFYGVTKDGCKAPIQKGNDFEVYETLAGTENRIYGHDIKRRVNLVKAVQEQGFDQVIEETAYTWFNRIIAIRFMEVNDYLPTRVRVLSSETGSNTPDIVTQSLDVDLNMTPEEIEKVQTAKDNNKYDEAFRLLFIKQCNELNDILPGLFERTDDYMELLLKLSYTNDGVVRMLVDTIPEDYFNVETEGQVEIIGWMYQSYISDLNAMVYDGSFSKDKINKELLPAATQLFTPDWPIRYMVENSLGRIFCNKYGKEPSWKYYLNNTNEDLNKDKFDICQVKFLDPCMGSGHILVYAFDVYMKIYENLGYNCRDAAKLIIENNLYGLDIDDRAFQLAYFAVMMKGRQFNRNIFKEVNKCNIYSIKESNSININHIEFMGQTLEQNERKRLVGQVNHLLHLFNDAKEIGSILKIDCYEWNRLREFVQDYSYDGQIRLEKVGIENTEKMLIEIIKIAEIMSFKYDVIVTNPPYLGYGRFSDKLSKYVGEYYFDEKTDLSMAMYTKAIEDFAKEKSYVAFITTSTWMSIKTFEKFRNKIINNYDIINLTDFGTELFEGKVGHNPIVAWVCKKQKDKGYESTAIRLVDYCYSQRTEKEKQFFNQDNWYQFNVEKLLNIDSAPIAYWVGDSILDNFNKGANISDFFEAIVKGIYTGDNNRFLRAWFEVNQDVLESKWKFYSKGGPFRKWYGNIEYVINWENNAQELRSFSGSGLGASKYFYKNTIVWTKISSYKTGFRLNNPNVFFDDASPALVFANDEERYYILGFLNSKVAEYMLSFLAPTVNYQCGDIKKLPIIIDERISSKIIELVKENIKISKEDWDYNEISSEFSECLLYKYRHIRSIEKAIKYAYEERYIRHQKLKNNEEMINEYFIKLYSADGIVSSKVDDKDVTLNLHNERDEIIDLISFFVGCLFGRYSNNSKFTVDEDAITPITDEGYIKDDIVNKFFLFIKLAFGEECFSENMEYIGKLLNNKGETADATIRSYFLNEFYRDHCSRYTITNGGRRPIYWQFDSGKENGFKALIYIHRYNKDTVGLIRSDYLHKVQDSIERALQNSEYIITTTTSAVDKAKATKARDKYIKQLNEIRSYYQALSHVALQRIDIDLDDGVKVNYAKFQGIEVSNEGTKKQTIDLLAKI